MNKTGIGIFFYKNYISFYYIFVLFYCKFFFNNFIRSLVFVSLLVNVPVV